MDKPKSRVVKAVHGIREIKKDPEFEIGLSKHLHEKYSRQGLCELYSRFVNGNGELDLLIRRAILRSIVKCFGSGIQINSGVQFKHPETFEIGNNVFLGEGTYIQGRFDGRCIIGNNTWIGPMSYFDARDLIIGENVGWGPGAKVLGSKHTGNPADVPIIQTDLEIMPVIIENNVDIGVNAVILPGVTIGESSIIGAGAVVVKDVPPYSVVAGVPAKVIRSRKV
ncbi:MAG: acyltransferase [Methanoregula sp.]